MSVSELVRLSHEKIKPNIGSRVLNSKDELLSGELGEALRGLLEERGVLVFPEVDFTDAEQVALTKMMGKFLPELGGEDVYNISLDSRVNRKSDYLKGSLYWHIDGTMNAAPLVKSTTMRPDASSKRTDAVIGARARSASPFRVASW